MWDVGDLTISVDSSLRILLTANSPVTVLDGIARLAETLGIAARYRAGIEREVAGHITTLGRRFGT